MSSSESSSTVRAAEQKYFTNKDIISDKTFVHRIGSCIGSGDAPGAVKLVMVVQKLVSNREDTCEVLRSAVNYPFTCRAQTRIIEAVKAMVLAGLERTLTADDLVLARQFKADCIAEEKRNTKK